MKAYCIACKTRSKLYSRSVYDDRYGHPGIYDLNKCPNCSQIVQLPLLEDSSLGDLYTKYYPRSNINYKYIEELKTKRNNISTRLIRFLMGNNNQGQYYAKKGMIVLDYGCGAGESLAEMQSIGAVSYGIEKDRNVLDAARTLDLKIYSKISELPGYPNIRFDLIILNQVIEHVPDPSLLISELSNLMSDSGRIIIGCPNNKSVFAKLFTNQWINWHTPYHLHQFNKKSLKIFIKSIGLEITSIKTITPNLWTILQMRSLNEFTWHKKSNPMWTGEDVTEDLSAYRKKILASKPFYYKLNYDLIFRRKYFYAFLAIFNRIIDFIGYGDSILLSVKKKN